MTSLIVLQHAPCEHPGAIADARAILTGAKKYLPTLRPIAATVFSAWKDLL